MEKTDTLHVKLLILVSPLAGKNLMKSSHGIYKLFEINYRCHRGRGGTMRDNADKLE